MLVAVSLSEALKNNAIAVFAGVVLIIFGIIELCISIKYSRTVVHKGTTNGFMPLSVASSIFISIALIAIGALFLYFIFTK